MNNQIGGHTFMMMNFYEMLILMQKIACFGFLQLLTALFLQNYSGMD